VEDAALDRIVPLRDALSFMEEHVLSPAEAIAVQHGRRIPGEGEGHVRLTHNGELLAIAEAREGELQPVVVFAPA
jgi:hypothetical protein